MKKGVPSIQLMIQNNVMNMTFLTYHISVPKEVELEKVMGNESWTKEDKTC